MEDEYRDSQTTDHNNTKDTRKSYPCTWSKANEPGTIEHWAHRRNHYGYIKEQHRETLAWAKNQPPCFQRCGIATQNMPEAKVRDYQRLLINYSTNKQQNGNHA